MSKERFSAEDSDMRFYDSNGVEMTIEEVKRAQENARAQREHFAELKAEEEGIPEK